MMNQVFKFSDFEAQDIMIPRTKIKAIPDTASYSDIIDGIEHYYEKRENIDKDYWEEYFNSLYNSYGRAKNDKSGVREFESSFVFTLNNESYNYFQVFNSIIKYIDGKIMIRRISSECNGYNDSEYRENFGYGYNEKVLKKELKK